MNMDASMSYLSYEPSEGRSASRSSRRLSIDVSDLDLSELSEPEWLSMEYLPSDLTRLVEELNAAPEQITSLTLADLERLGVPNELLDELRVVIASGEPHVVAEFLELLAKSHFGDLLSKQVKRTIRAVSRRSNSQKWKNIREMLENMHYRCLSF